MSEHGNVAPLNNGDLRFLRDNFEALKLGLRTVPQSGTSPGGRVLEEADRLLAHLEAIKAAPPREAWDGHKARLLALVITHLEEARGRLLELLLSCLPGPETLEHSAGEPTDAERIEAARQDLIDRAKVAFR